MTYGGYGGTNIIVMDASITYYAITIVQILNIRVAIWESLSIGPLVPTCIYTGVLQHGEPVTKSHLDEIKTALTPDDLALCMALYFEGAIAIK